MAGEFDRWLRRAAAGLPCPAVLLPACLRLIKGEERCTLVLTEARGNSVFPLAALLRIVFRSERELPKVPGDGFLTVATRLLLLRVRLFER